MTNSFNRDYRNIKPAKPVATLHGWFIVYAILFYVLALASGFVWFN